MNAPDRKVRVFISSTFRDMHAERDHLVTVVFPELRERCERLGLEFFDVDLRWGVPDKNVDGESANSWEYCRKWINEAKPFFICLLGQRYGWEPEPHQLKEDTDQQAQAADRRSITDMEVHHALENDAHSRRCYFYIRQAQAPITATEFVDPPPLPVKLDALKARVEACGRPVWHYPCRWTGSGFTDMEAFGKKVLEDLWSGILRDPRYVSREAWQQVLGTDLAKDSRYTDESQPVLDDLAEKLIPLAKPPPKNPLEAERDEMQRFADSRLKWFQGREQELNELLQFIANPAEAHDLPRLAVIAAQPGQGKSALMAKLWEALQPKETKEDEKGAASDARRVEDNAPYLISHFVGATSQSSSSYHLVKRLNDELDHSGIAFPERRTPEGQTKEEPKLDFQSLCQRLWDRLGDYAGEQRIVILLDALNQIDDGHELGWLPYRLGPSVRVVVSCIEETPTDSENPPRGIQSDETQSAASLNLREKPKSENSAAEKVLAALDSRHPKPKRIPLGPLTADDVRTIVTSYLTEYCKQLDAPHVDAICDEQKLPKVRNPLYLLVMLAELRTLGGNDMNQHVPVLIASMGTQHPDTVSLFHWVLQRLEQAEGFGEQAVRWWCLYLALGRVGMSSRELSDLLVRKLGSDSASTAQRIERALRRYLQRRGEQLDFFHGQIRQAVMERYCGEAIAVQGHHDIANYFRSLADPAGDQSWAGDRERPLNETAAHLIGAEEWDDLCDYLTDFRCLDARIRAGQVFAVVMDQRAAIAALPELEGEARRERERVETCAQYGGALAAYASDCAKGKISSLPQPPPYSRRREVDARPRKTTTRSDQLKAIATFVQRQASLIVEFPDDFLAMAANATEGPPLSGAAQNADEVGHPWLHRNPRPPIPYLNPLCLVTLEGHTDSVNSVALSTDGFRAISGSSDNTLRVWDLNSGQCIAILQDHAASVNSVALSADGFRAISGSSDNTLRVWDLNSGQCIAILQGHADSVNSVALSADGLRALSICMHHMCVWDLGAGRCLDKLHHRSICMTLSPDGAKALSCNGEYVVFRDLLTGQWHIPIRNLTAYFLSMAISPDCSHVLSGCSDGNLRFWNLAGDECRPDQPRRSHSERISCVSLSHDGSFAVSGSWSNELRVWNTNSGSCVASFPGRAYNNVIWSIAISRDGSRVLSGSRDKTVRVWDLASGQCIAILQDHTDQVHSVAFAPDGSRALSGCRDGTLRLWDLSKGDCVITLKGHTSSIRGMAFLNDGSRAISGSIDGTLRLWNLESGACLTRYQCHNSCDLYCLAVSLNGSRAVSGGWETLRVLDLRLDQCLRTLRGHKRRTEIFDPSAFGNYGPRASITDDGSRAVTCADDKTLRVWDLERGDCLAVYHAGSGIEDVAISPTGGCIVCATQDGQMHFLTPKNFPLLV